MKYLLLFTISPVQSFIEQARKTRDLFAGSKLLSDLIDFAMKQIPKAEFIFPSKDIGSKPNRFIAKIECENDEKIKELSSNIKKSVRDKFKSIAIQIVEEKTDKNKNDLPNNFVTQIENHLQIHWAALPYEEDKYQEQFREIESSLGAIKNVRAFNQNEETGRKCSLCGERNVLFFNSKDKDSDNVNPSTGLKKRFFQAASININKIYGIKYSLTEGEGLCAVCFIKRFYKEEIFPSTAKIALMESIDKLKKIENGNFQIDNYEKLFGSDFDYQLYYEENLRKNYFEKENKNFENSKITEAKSQLLKISKLANKNNIKLPGYYAVIMFDGDSMGKWLSGLKLKNDADLLQFHRTLSKSLGEFADGVRLIIAEPKGTVVYAGGEDFLGFINLNYLFKILKLLRELFDCKVNQAIKDYKLNATEVLSFSAGIVVAHYKDPLSEVLKWARELEKEAKKKYSDKNAFVIAIVKHSGEINKTSYKWGDEENTTKILDIIANVTELLIRDKFSNTFINSITSELLSINDHKGLSFPINIVKAELKRLLTRSCKITKQQSETNDRFKERKKTLILETVENISILYSDLNTESFFSALNVAEFISRYINGDNNEN